MEKEVRLKINTYSEDTGFSFAWEDGFEITTLTDGDEIRILANKAGLISIAKNLIALAENEVPKHHHLHLDDLNSLEEGSIDLIIEKIE